jgi:hypothetical protein
MTREQEGAKMQGVRDQVRMYLRAVGLLRSEKEWKSHRYPDETDHQDVVVVVVHDGGLQEVDQFLAASLL